MTDAAAETPPGLTLAPASLWRRLGAAIMDMLLLGLAGLGLGVLVPGELTDLGRWGFLVGLTVAGGYFSVLNSGLGKGQTLGKRLVRIEVVSESGDHASIGRTAPRFLLLYVPYFLNGQALPADLMFNIIGAGVLSLLVFGLALANLYLLLFNRPLRQGLHDLWTSTRVVALPRHTESLAKPWSGHPRVAVALMLLTLVLPAALMPTVGRLFDGVRLDDLARTQNELERLDDVLFASLQDTTRRLNDGPPTTSLDAVLVVRHEPTSDGIAAAACETVLREYPQIMERQYLNVSLMRGYDIGIASYWTTWNALSIEMAGADPEDVCKPKPRGLPPKATPVHLRG